MASEQFFIYIIARTMSIFHEMMRFALYQTKKLGWFL